MRHFRVSGRGENLPTTTRMSTESVDRRSDTTIGPRPVSPKPRTKVEKQFGDLQADSEPRTGLLIEGHGRD